MLLATLHDTIYALSTPLGKSAIAVMRITGADAIAVVGRYIENPSKLFSTRGGDSFYTNLIDDNCIVVDDVVVTVFRTPRSFTGEDLVEIHTHGSTVIVDLLQHLLHSGGVRAAEAGEFSRRAYMNGKIGIEQLETVSLRIDALSERSLIRSEEFVKKKYERLRSVYADLVALLAHVNAQIDFGESDHVEVEDLQERTSVLQNALHSLLLEAANKAAGKQFFTIALSGPPNVGKSSIFNALLKYERSIVSDTPGTTRDYLEAFLILDGFRVKLMDTAGLRESFDHIESKGISLGIAISEEADLILHVTDPGTRDAKPSGGEILLHNKCDLDSFTDPFAISATTGKGLDGLIDYLSTRLSKFDAEFSGYSISDSERSLISSVLHTLEKVESFDDITILAEELKDSASTIESLLGKNLGEDSLNHIFSKMCIGK